MTVAAEVGPDSWVRNLAPGYFAVVMATGIISVGLHLQGHHVTSGVMLVAAVAAFVVLLVLNGVRLVRYAEAMAADFYAPQRAFGFFTLIATANGTWFLWVVAAQSVAVSTATLQPAIEQLGWRSLSALLGRHGGHRCPGFGPPTVAPVVD